MTRRALSRKDDVMSMMTRLAATIAVAVVSGSSLVAQTRSVFIEDLTSPELRERRRT